MHNDYSGTNDNSKFLTKDDEAARMRDEAAVEMARQVHEWSKDNLSRFDKDGNDRVNFGELDLGARTTRNNESADALAYLQDNYKQIQDRSQNRFLFIKGTGGISADGIGEFVNDLEKRRDENAQALAKNLQERALQAGSREVVAGLMETCNGNPNDSLFRVIDSLDGDIDNEISKKDLNRYLDEYAKRSRYGDIGEGYFTPETRRYVEHLKANWDKPEMVRLRGTWTRRDNHNDREEEVPNSTISEKSLKKAIGLNKHDDMFAPFVIEDKQVATAKPVAKQEIEVTPLPPIEKPVAEAAKKVEAAKPERIEMVKAEPAKQAEKVAKAEPKVAKVEEKKVVAKETKAAAPEPKVAAPEAKVAKAEKSAAPEPKAAPAPKVEQAVPKVVEADAANRLPFSPWKADAHTVSSAVAARITDNYFNAEQYYEKTNAQAAAKDQAEVKKAVHMHEWGKDNLRRFDTSGDDRLNYGELDLGARTSRSVDRYMLRSIQAEFEPLKKQSGGGFLFVDRPDAISEKDLRVNVEKKQEMADNNERARQDAAAQRSEQAKTEFLLSGLLATPTGNPNQSLFRVIDGMDNDIDHEISRRDLGRYLNEYEKRSRYGDVGRGFFSAPTRNYVEELKNSWDSPEIKKLRGTYIDNDHRERAYDHINLDRLRKMLGLSKQDDIFQNFTLERE